MKLRRRARRTLIGLSITLPVIAVVGVFVMLLWNVLVPDLFGGPTLSYLQAVGVLLLSHLLFRGSPLHGLRVWRRARRRQRWKQRLASLTPEEFAAFRGELGIQGSDDRQL